MILLKEIVLSQANKNRFWKKYAADIAKDFDGKFSYEDLAKRYNLVQQTIKKDFFSFLRLKDLVRAVDDAETKIVAKRAEKSEMRKNIDVISSDGTWIVARPKNEEAACLLGKNTKWCISATKSMNHFDSYKNKGAVHVLFINRKTNEKFAATIYSYNGKTLLDARDAEDRDLFDTMDGGMEILTFEGKIFRVHNHEVFYRIDQPDKDTSISTIKTISDNFKSVFGMIPSNLVEKASEYLYTHAIKNSESTDVDGNEIYNLSDDFKIIHKDQGNLLCVPKNEETMVLMELSDRNDKVVELLKNRKLVTVMEVSVIQNPVYYRWYFLSDKGEFGRISSYHIIVYTNDLPEVSSHDISVYPLEAMTSTLILHDIKMHRRLSQLSGRKLNDEEKSLKSLWEKEENGTSLKSLYTYLVFGADNLDDLKTLSNQYGLDLYYQSNKNVIDQQLFNLFRLMYSFHGPDAFFRDYNKSIRMLADLLGNPAIMDAMSDLNMVYHATRDKNPVWKKFRSDMINEPSTKMG